MLSSTRSLIPFFILSLAALAAATPVPLPVRIRIPPRFQWTTPPTCLRGVATYNFKRCAVDLNDLIRLAHDSVKGIEIIGMRLVDVIGPSATLLPAKLPVTHTCYPTTHMREQNSDNIPEQLWGNGDFVPFRLNLACDEHDRVISFSWH